MLSLHAYMHGSAEQDEYVMWLKIGEFADLSRVSARMLRHYDRVGILKPIHIDVLTGYRYYSIEQLPRLKRICALRDLAFTLDDIALLLADDEPAVDLRHLLQQKQQELHQRIADDQARVQRIETRLRTLEQEYHMETHNEHEILTSVLTEQYDISVGHVERVYGDSANRFYHVADTTGKHWDAYVSRADGLADTVYTTWLSGYGGHSLPDFQLSRAGILVHLETEQYPTQRLRRTQNDVVRPINWANWYVRILRIGGFHEAQSAYARTNHQDP
jgi:DNA-binding transcriptional MerR regulator